MPKNTLIKLRPPSSVPNSMKVEYFACVTGQRSADTYDPSHRNPLYCLADTECVWELRKLAEHYHPSVALFASKLLKVRIPPSRLDFISVWVFFWVPCLKEALKKVKNCSLLQKEQISYTGDPLHDFTLIRFLDRFVYRNPKKKDSCE